MYNIKVERFNGNLNNEYNNEDTINNYLNQSEI